MQLPGRVDRAAAFVANQAASYTKGRRLDFVDVIPQSPSGKILRERDAI